MKIKYGARQSNQLEKSGRHNGVSGILGMTTCKILNRIMYMVLTERNGKSKMRVEIFPVKGNGVRKGEEVGKCTVHAGKFDSI